MATPATSGNAGPSAPVDLDGTIGVAFIGLILSALLVHIYSWYIYHSERFGLGCSGSRMPNCTSTTFSTLTNGSCTKSRSAPCLAPHVTSLT